MANTIRIKRRLATGTAGAPSSLKNAELAYNEKDNKLYYGFGDDGGGNATSIIAIAGSGAFSATDHTHNNLTIKFDTGSTEGTDLYTYNGGTAKTFDIKAGTNVSLTKTSSSITINATDTNTTYSAGTGLTLNSTTFNHSNSVTAGTVSEGGSARTLAYGGTFNIPSVTYDAQGHVTSTTSVQLTLPAVYTHPTYTYTAPTADTVTTLSSIPFISTLAQTNGHVTGGTMRKLVAGTNISITPASDGNVTISSTDTNTDTLQSISDDTSTASDYYPTFVTATSGAQAGKVSSTKFTFNPSTGLLKATKIGVFSGTSSQFLKGDGTVDTNTYLTSAGAVTSFKTDLPGLSPSTATVGAVNLTGILQAGGGGSNGGGTGVATYAAGDILYAGSANPTALSKLTIGTAKQVITSTGTAPSWADLDLSYIPTSWAKKSVKAATTADLSAASSTASTITGTNVAFPAQDGITISVGDRILVKNQTSAKDNGIYTLTQQGVASTTPWILTRVTDADAASELDGATVNVDQGSTNGGWLFSNQFKTTDTVGSTAMPWYRIVNTLDLDTANTANKVVLRDGSGNFLAGTITATLSGTATQVSNSITFNTTGGAAAGTTFDGSVAKTIDYSTVGAAAAGHNHGTGTTNKVVKFTNTNGTIGDSTISDDGTTVSMSGNLTITGNLTVNGGTTTVNSTTITVDDPIITLGGDTAPGSDDNKDRGVEYRYFNGAAKVGFFGFDDSTGYFTFIPDATNTSEVFSGTKGYIDVLGGYLTNLYINGSSSGTVLLNAQASASGTLTLPNGNDTLVGRATTDTLTNKTLTNPIIDNVKASGAAIAADLWSEITTGSITIGAGLTTGTLTLDGSSTNTHTVNFATGASASGKTKTVNIGTGGVSGSTTSISIGSSAGTSTTTINGTTQLTSGSTKIGNTTLAQGVTGTITFPSSAGTLALTTDIPTVNNGTLTVTTGSATSGNAITIGNGTGFTANSSSGATVTVQVGPALTALATIMNSSSPSTGYVKKTGTDTYAIDDLSNITIDGGTF